MSVPLEEVVKRLHNQCFKWWLILIPLPVGWVFRSKLLSASRADVLNYCWVIPLPVGWVFRSKKSLSASRAEGVNDVRRFRFFDGSEPTNSDNRLLPERNLTTDDLKYIILTLTKSNSIHSFDLHTTNQQADSELNYHTHYFPILTLTPKAFM